MSDEEIYIDPWINGQVRLGAWSGWYLREHFGLVDDGTGGLVPADEAREEQQRERP